MTPSAPFAQRLLFSCQLACNQCINMPEAVVCCPSLHLESLEILPRGRCFSILREVPRGRGGLQAGRVGKASASARLVALIRRAEPRENSEVQYIQRPPRWRSDDDGVAVDVESLAIPVSHASLAFSIALRSSWSRAQRSGVKGFFSPVLVEGHDRGGGFTQVAVTPDVEFNARTGRR